MIGRGTALLFVAAGLAGMVFALMAMRDSALPALLSGDNDALIRDEKPNSRASRDGPQLDGILDEIQDGLAAAPGRLWHAARLPLAVAVLVLLAMLGVRRTARARRRYVRLRLIPYRSDETESAEILRLFESWHQQLVERWWRRIALGQPSIALELVMQQDGEGDCISRLSIVCPRQMTRAAEGALLGCYPDVRLLGDAPPLPRLETIVRLKKRFPFVRALRTLDEKQRFPVDSILSNMESLGRPAVVQYVLTPTPALFDRYSRWRFGSVERGSERARASDPQQPGLRSELLGRELEGGLRVQHRALYFAELRVAAGTYHECQAISGIVRGESSGENRLVVRHMRPWGRGPLYLRRLEAGTGNPVPSWRRGVFSSAELAALWQLPTPGLKVARLERSPLPRMPAPPEVSRRPEHVLMRDESGPVGLRPEDKTDGLGLIGGQKTGKTSVLCRTVLADALDSECALVVLMPKPGDALKALSMVPRGRVVHYLDLEAPEFGINPLAAPGDPAMVADKIVDAFRDVNVEGDIRGSSDRYLRQAAQAAIGASRSGVLEGAPTLWHMYRMLMPVEHAFRERIVESLSLDPRYADTATFFGRELPSDLENAPSQTTAKLDAPRNKLLRLLVESLDKVLRHPIQLDLHDVVRRREVLVVDGKMGTFGADNCRVMMQFILSALYGALRAQQELPEAERVRVGLKVDEAHLILNDSFADAMATLRSGGLEVVAAWQYGEQIQDRKIRGGMMSLLRQRCMFSMGETEDAREMSSLAMAVYSDMIRDTPESRARMRVTPDTIFNLPNYHAVCSWISRGARVPAFIGQTIPLEYDEDAVFRHVEAQRERGCHVPARLPDPLPDLDWNGHRELPTEVLPPARPATPREVIPTPEPEAPVAAPVGLDFDPAAASVDRATERARSAPARLPESYTELDLDNVRGLAWDKVTPLPPDRRHEPSGRELEVLGALWNHRFLFASQIWRRWWPDSSLRAAQQALNKMARAGWVRRFKLQVGERGAQQRVYCLTRLGFDIARERVGRHGAYIDPEANWREPVISDPRRILRSLHVNGWVLAFETSAGRVLHRWRGPREGRLQPPRRRVRGQWLDLLPQDIVIGASHKLRDYEPSAFEPVSPDATLELRIPTGDRTTRFDLLVELDRVSSPAASEDRLRRYDGLISGWAGMLDRYKALGTPPVVVFVCEDERAALALLRIADGAVTARLAKPGTEEAEWPHPARRAMFFAVESEIHIGSLQAFRLPEFPPELRERLNGRKARACRPERVNIIEPRLLGLAQRSA